MYIANLVIIATVQVFGTPVSTLKTSSNVNSSGKGETLLHEKTLLLELALQPTDESVAKSIIQDVPKIAEGRCLSEVSYILCYRLQRFLFLVMEMESLFNHQRLWLEMCPQSSVKVSERFTLWLLQSQ